MRGYAYDIEIFKNFFSVTFLDLNSSESKVFVIYNGFWVCRDDYQEMVSFLRTNPILIGFNNKHFDDLLLALMLKGQKDPYKIYKAAQLIIGEKRNEDIYELRQWASKHIDSIDLMTLFHLDSIGVGLKQIAINLKHDWIQDLPIPYDSKVEDEMVELILEYNLNDVVITKKLYQEAKEEIELRESIGRQYGLDVRSDSDSRIATSILTKLYAQKTKKPISSFRDSRSRRSKVFLRDIISSTIEFKSDTLTDLMRRLNETVLKEEDNFLFNGKVFYGGKVYNMGVGGLHSEDEAGKFSSSEERLVIDVDVASFYPNIILINEIYPEHLEREAFLAILREMTERRLKAKKEGDKVTAQTLKITINSIFGRLGSDQHWLYDPKAFYGVTINGQLYLLMLIESLCLNGFEVISANTDGVVTIVPKSKLEQFKTICSDWEVRTGFELEDSFYSQYVRRDVNNYLTIKDKGVKTKGVFDVTFDGEGNIKVDLSKGYKSPIIPLALYKYFVEGAPIEDTVRSSRDIHDFIISQKTSKNFTVFYQDRRGETELQKTNRFYIATEGGFLIKRDGGREIGIYANVPVQVVNDLRHQTFEDFRIDYSFYVGEIQKIVSKIIPPSVQIKLF